MCQPCSSPLLPPPQRDFCLYYPRTVLYILKEGGGGCGGGHKGAWGRGVEGENGVELPGYIFVSLLFSILFPFFPFFFLWTNYYIFYVEWFFFFPVSRPPTSTSPHTLLLLGFTVYCAYCGGILISPTWSFAVGVCCAMFVYLRGKQFFLFFFSFFDFDCVWWYFSTKVLVFQPYGYFQSFYHCYSGLHLQISSIKAQFLWSYFSLLQCLGGRVPSLTKS